MSKKTKKQEANQSINVFNGVVTPDNPYGFCLGISSSNGLGLKIDNIDLPTDKTEYPVGSHGLKIEFKDKIILCCHISKKNLYCKREATHQLFDSKDPYDYTYSCRKHLGNMLTDVDDQRIIKLKNDDYILKRTGVYINNRHVKDDKHAECDYINNRHVKCSRFAIWNVSSPYKGEAIEHSCPVHVSWFLKKNYKIIE